jgi:hypothetical protein
MKTLRLIALLLTFGTGHGCFFAVSLNNGTGTLFVASGECNAWFIAADSGPTYQLTSLDPTFQTEGMRVRYSVRQSAHSVSTCMRGQVVDVVSIAKL